MVFLRDFKQSKNVAWKYYVCALLEINKKALQGTYNAFIFRGHERT